MADSRRRSLLRIAQWAALPILVILIIRALAPHISEGISLNFATEIGEDALKESFGAKKVERLRALKDRYDATNFFRFNQNIAPSA